MDKQLELLILTNKMLVPSCGITHPNWDYCRCSLTETLVQETAAALVSSGLADAGYNHVNIDDCWQVINLPACIC